MHGGLRARDCCRRRRCSDGGSGQGALVAGLLIASLPNAMAQMTLPGDFAVTSTGGANYKIPIVVPPGTAGMVPSMSLEYSSETGGNANGWLGAGLVGVGWTLAGLPAVGRCPQTVAQDGVIVAVNYNANDRFCLEGQRLMAISGAYGADGTEYRTELESFSRMISHGTAGTGPAWFEVHTKSGQVLQFGNTVDSQILAQGKTTARSWGVNKVSDTKGNYYYDNLRRTTRRTAKLIRAGSTTRPMMAPVSRPTTAFVLSIRRAPTLRRFFTRARLSKQRCCSPMCRPMPAQRSSPTIGSPLTQPWATATGRSQLASVTLCDGGESTASSLACRQQTSPGKTERRHLPFSATSADQNGTLVGSRPYLADFTGDGRTDILWDSSVDTVRPYFEWHARPVECRDEYRQHIQRQQQLCKSRRHPRQLRPDRRGFQSRWTRGYLVVCDRSIPERLPKLCRGDRRHNG